MGNALPKPISRASSKPTARSLLPPTGSFGRDCFSFWITATLQLAVIPNLLGTNALDLITPWLVIYCATQPVQTSVFFALVGGIILETFSMVPAGLYLCAYGTVAATLLMLRDAFSWRYQITWLATISAASIWLAILESLVIAVSRNTSVFTGAYSLTLLVRFVSSLVVGLIIYRSRRPLRNRGQSN